MKLAVITARGGSKRIPRKNIRTFCGKPIIAYSIETALSSACFDEVMVSTDDAEIAAVAKQYGARVPFMRSTKTADDFATTSDVLCEVIQEYHDRDIYPEYLCCIYPTAPLITSEQLISGFTQLKNNSTLDLLFPVAPFSFPIQRALRYSNERLSFFYPDYALTRSQECEKAYHDAGQFYWYRVNACLQNRFRMTDHVGAIILPPWQVQDIDTIEDWKMAEIKYQLMQQPVTTT